MKYNQVIQDCNRQANLYHKLGRAWDEKHEIDCISAIEEVFLSAKKDIEKICKNGSSPCRICSKCGSCNRPIADYCSDFEWRGVSYD